MITVTILRDHDSYKGIHCEGHAFFAEHGKDIVCAAASVLVINTMNGIEAYCDDAFTLDIPEEKKSEENWIDFRFTEGISDQAKLLFDVMILGLQDMERQYGSKYITLQYEEV